MKTKNDVYVVVDTPKKAEKLKEVLDMFGERIYNNEVLHNDGFPCYSFDGFNFSGYIGFRNKTKVSIKQLKQILAKEHLKEGDWIIARCSHPSCDYLVKVDRIEDNMIKGYYSFVSNFNNKWVELSDSTGGFEKFKRYATPEEIELLNPKPKELEVGKWYKKVNKQGEVFIFNHQEKGKSYGWFKGDWSTCAWYTDSFVDYVLLTNQEVESALIEEAKRRYKVVFYGFEFDYDKNILFGHYEDSKVVELFNNGKWATIIEQDKFAELKEAHNNGAVIECLQVDGTWYEIEKPQWNDYAEYRIKPEEKLKVSKELKEAFKNGFGVEFRRDSNSEWKRHDNPCWSSKFEWRLMLVNGHPYIRDNYLRDKIDELENRLNKLNNI